MTPIIELENVSCGYSEDRKVLEDINLRIDEPEYICIIGPNGVGKSTLIRVIDRIIHPMWGTVRVFGRNVSEYKLKELSKLIGYVPVISADFNAETVLNTVLIGRYTHQKHKATPEDLKIAYKALAAMEIEELADRNFNKLSAGQRQKVSLARGLAQEPKVLILDEPTANLDVRHQVYVNAFLRELSERTQTTVLSVSHDINLAAKYAHKLIVLRKPGRLYAYGTPGEIITRNAIREVYGVDCDIIEHGGVPHVILENVLE